MSKMNVRQAILQQCRFERHDKWREVILGAFWWAQESGLSEGETAERELFRSAANLVWLNFGRPDIEVQWPDGITIADVEFCDVWGMKPILRTDWTPKQLAVFWTEIFASVKFEDEGWWVTSSDWLPMLSELVTAARSAESPESASVTMVRNSYGEPQLWLQLRESGIQKLRQPSLALNTSSPPSTNGSSPSS